MADLKRVNGNLLSWGSGVTKVEGERFVGWTEISYGDKRERTQVHGQQKSQAARGRTRGKYTASKAKLKGPYSTIVALMNKLASLSEDGVSYGDVECQVMFQFSERNEPAVTVELVDCVIEEISEAFTEGSEGLLAEVTLDVMRVRRNGLVLFDSAEEE